MRHIEFKLLWTWLLLITLWMTGCGRDQLFDRPGQGERWETGEDVSDIPIDPPDPEVRLISINIVPDKIELPLSGERNVILEARFSDGTSEDVTEQAAWSLEGEAGVARLEGTRVIAQRAGEMQLVAELGERKATAPVVVIDRELLELRIAPRDVEIRPGGRVQLTAWGLYEGALVEEELTAVATWSVDNEGVAVVSNEATREGEVVGVVAGEVEVTARIGDVATTANVKVSASADLVEVVVTPPVSDLLLGASETFTAYGFYTDGTASDVTALTNWSVEPEGVVDLNADGVATALAAGEATLVGNFQGLEGRATIRVSDASILDITLFPREGLTGVGGQTQYTADARLSDGTRRDISRYATWTTTDASIASVEQGGMVRARSPGVAIITAELQGVTGQARHEVTTSPVTGLDIEPIAPVLAPGVRLPLQAVARYADGTSSAVTLEADWENSNPQAATLDERGVLFGRAPGTTVVRAAFEGFEAVASVTVIDAELTRIEVDPPDIELGPNQSMHLEATGTYTDGTQLDLTESVSWSSNAPAVAVSNSTGERGKIWTLSLGGATITATLGMVSGQAVVTVTDTRLESIAIEPDAVTLPLGTSTRLKAMGQYLGEEDPRDITELVSWESDNPLLVAARNTPGEEGRVVALETGTVTVRANLAGVQGEAAVTVTDAALTAIEVTPADAVLTVGAREAYTATGVFDDGARVDVTALASWSSTNDAIAQALNSEAFRGEVVAKQPGEVDIRARVDGVTGQTRAFVQGARINRLIVTPEVSTTVLGETRQFTATAILEDGSPLNVTGQSAWESADAAIATINEFGVATAKQRGQTQITATYQGVSATVTMDVNGSQLVEIQVTPHMPEVAQGTLMRFWATAIYSDGTREDVSDEANWNSDNQAVMGIFLHPRWRGIGNALSEGTATISAEYRGVVGQTTATVTDAELLEIKVTPIEVTVAPGTELQYLAQAVFSDGTSRDVTWGCNWTTDNEEVADVFLEWQDRGKVTARREGTAEIRATYQGVTGTSVLNVTAATISYIQVVPFAPSVNQGDQLRFWATAVYTDGTQQQITQDALWQTLDPNIAEVSNSMWQEGLVTTYAPGTTKILATYQGVTGETTLTVTGLQIDQIQVTPFIETIPSGYYLRMLATAIYNNGTSRDITGLATWTATDPNVVDVYASYWVRGWSLGVGPGTGFIQATYQGKTGQAKVTVTDATLTSIELTPNTGTILPGETIEFEAEGTFSDGSTREVTHYVTWSSTDQSVGDVSNAWISRGEATGFSPGVTTIRATQGMVTGEATLTVGGSP